MPWPSEPPRMLCLPLQTGTGMACGAVGSLGPAADLTQPASCMMCMLVFLVLFYSCFSWNSLCWSPVGDFFFLLFRPFTSPGLVSPSLSIVGNTFGEEVSGTHARTHACTHSLTHLLTHSLYLLTVYGDGCCLGQAPHARCRLDILHDLSWVISKLF